MRRNGALAGTLMMSNDSYFRSKQQSLLILRPVISLGAIFMSRQKWRLHSPNQRCTNNGQAGEMKAEVIGAILNGCKLCYERAGQAIGDRDAI